MNIFAKLLPVVLSVGLVAVGCVRREQTEVTYVAARPATQSRAGGPEVSVSSAGGTYAVTRVPPAAEPATLPAPGPARYVLVGSDAQTNPYQGDAAAGAALPILCLHAAGLADPGLSPEHETRGGARRRRWSGAEVALTEPIAGSALTTRAIADQECNRRFGDGWRMAEFHDGGPRAGWDFWAYAVSGDFTASRFFVAIDDQPANPWSSDRAMTWRLLDAR